MTLPERFDVLLAARAVLVLIGIWWAVGSNVSKDHPSLFQSFLLSDISTQSMFVTYAIYRMCSGLVTGRFPLTPQGIRKYLLNYGMRILPIYWAISILGAILAGIVAKPLPPASEFIPRELFLIQWNYGNHVTWIFWTVGLTAQFALFCPALIAFFTRMPHGFDMAIGVYAALLLWLHLHIAGGGYRSELTNLLNGLLCLHAGIILALGEKPIRKWLETAPEWFLRALLIGLGVVWVLSGHFGRRGSAGTALVKAILFTNLIVACLFVLHWVGKDRKWDLGPMGRVAMLLGVFSFQMAAWSRIVLNYFPWIFRDDFLSTCIGALALSFMTFILVEKPVLELKKRWIVAPLPGPVPGVDLN